MPMMRIALSRMVCAFGAGLALAGLAYPFLRGSPAHALKGSIAALRWCAALLLAVSAVALVFAPRSDQPLIDAVEYALPLVRSLYFTKSELATYEDARRYAERHRLEAERLNDMARKSKIIAGLKDAVRYSRGDLTRGKAYVVQVPRPIDVRAIREKLGLSQAQCRVLAVLAVHDEAMSQA